MNERNRIWAASILVARVYPTGYSVFMSNSTSFSIEVLRARSAARAAARAARTTTCYCLRCANVRRAASANIGAAWRETYMVGAVCRRRMHLTVIP